MRNRFFLFLYFCRSKNSTLCFRLEFFFDLKGDGLELYIELKKLKWNRNQVWFLKNTLWSINDTWLQRHTAITIFAHGELLWQVVGNSEVAQHKVYSESTDTGSHGAMATSFDDSNWSAACIKVCLTRIREVLGERSYINSRDAGIINTYVNAYVKSFVLDLMGIQLKRRLSIDLKGFNQHDVCCAHLIESYSLSGVWLYAGNWAPTNSDAFLCHSPPWSLASCL